MAKMDAGTVEFLWAIGGVIVGAVAMQMSICWWDDRR